MHVSFCLKRRTVNTAIAEQSSKLLKTGYLSAVKAKLIVSSRDLLEAKERCEG